MSLQTFCEVAWFVTGERQSIVVPSGFALDALHELKIRGPGHNSSSSGIDDSIEALDLTSSVLLPASVLAADEADSVLTNVVDCKFVSRGPTRLFR